MKSIFDILTSRAISLVLRTLYFQQQAIPLRHISAMSGLPVFSVQNALRSLADENMVNRTEQDNNVLFDINKDHPLYHVLDQFFSIETNNRIEREAAVFYERAKRALKFASDAGAIFKYAKLGRI